MAKRSKKKKARAIQENAEPIASDPKQSHSKATFGRLVLQGWIPLLLAVVTFLVYWPSLQSDFVYDAREEILQEGFITSISNLPAVLSLKVLGMNLMLGPRPGTLLYLMLIAAVCGKAPFGYHLCSNLLHAANVALLFVLLRRLVKAEMTGLTRSGARRVQLAVAAVTLVFALHPLTVEPVSAINYSSDLLVTFFLLLALLAATVFKPEHSRTALLAGGVGTLCAFAAVTCKESGLAASLLLIVYWFLFRRHEAKGPWLWFLGAALSVTVVFLTARFLFALPSPQPLSHLGGSFFQVFLIQPRLWIFMMGKLLWPVQLSADYTLEDLSGISTPVALAILGIVGLLQGWLMMKSRLGALGVAIYWLGLATVSNFIPLNRILGDRFYYLPLAGLAMQLLAFLLMTLKFRDGFWAAVLPLLVATTPLPLLTVTREAVFANEYNLWADTIQASPYSWNGHNGRGLSLFNNGQVEEAIDQYRKALELNPNYADAHDNLGIAFFKSGHPNEAISEYQAALNIDPKLAIAHYITSGMF